MISLPRTIADELVAHAHSGAPLEACGLLAGRDDMVHKSYRMTNLDHSAEHFSLDPREQLAAIRDARGLGLEIIAVYHSHPATPARMSDEDLRLAVTPGLRYLIVSLAGANAPEIKAFTVNDGRPQDELLTITETAAKV